jgi:hypothetical protein
VQGWHYFYWPKLGDDVFHYVRQCELSVCKAGAEYQNGVTHCDTNVLSHGAGVGVGHPVRIKRKSGYFGSNGQLFKVYGIFFRTEHNFHGGM